jgi:transcriptional regulator with XRE-family HTH domain
MAGPGAPDVPALEIGPRLAAHRAQRGMKVSALARRVGVSASLISQIERGQSRPSVSTLLALAEALDVPVDAFFRDTGAGERDTDGNGRRRHPPPAGGERPQPGRGEGRAKRYLVRSGERATIAIEGGVRWERLTPTQLGDLEFMELVYSPGAESHATQYRHPGMEMVLVLDGRLDISVGSEHYELEPGDSLCFPSTMPHRYRNPTEQTTRAATVILRDGGTPEPTTDRRA